MTPSAHTKTWNTLTLACLAMCTAASNPAAFAQVPTTTATSAVAVAAAAAATTSSTEAAAAGINPMTGRPLSEEELHRHLNKSKLVTQLGQEQVKQAQNAADLSLATLRQEAERLRLRSESLAHGQSATSTARAGDRSVTTIRPLPAPGVSSGPTQMPMANLPGAPSAYDANAASPMPRPQATPSGTIQIGGEILNVSAHASARSEPAQVQWVDSQTKQVARAGSPLNPIQVQPATGMLGIPAIPGIMPAPQGQ